MACHILAAISSCQNKPSPSTCQHCIVRTILITTCHLVAGWLYCLIIRSWNNPIMEKCEPTHPTTGRDTVWIYFKEGFILKLTTCLTPLSKSQCCAENGGNMYFLSSVRFCCYNLQLWYTFCGWNTRLKYCGINYSASKVWPLFRTYCFKLLFFSEQNNRFFFKEMRIIPLTHKQEIKHGVNYCKFTK